MNPLPIIVNGDLPPDGPHWLRRGRGRNLTYTLEGIDYELPVTVHKGRWRKQWVSLIDGRTHTRGVSRDNALSQTYARFVELSGRKP